MSMINCRNQTSSKEIWKFCSQKAAKEHPTEYRKAMISIQHTGAVCTERIALNHEMADAHVAQRGKGCKLESVSPDV